MTIARLWFTKTGEAAYISLLDLQRVMQRAFRMAKAPAWYTLGFNPHIYMTFAAPLALGQESLVESLDFKTEAENYDWDAAARRLTACLPHGVEVVCIEPARDKAEAIAAARYEVRWDAAHAAAARGAFAFFAAAPCAEVLKKGKHNTQRTLDLKTCVTVESTQDTPAGFTAVLRLPAGNTLNVNPMLLLTWLEEQKGLPAASGSILRTALLREDGENFR